MLLLFGTGLLIVVWALLIAWIAKLAQGRGRFIAGWAIGAAVAGVLGYFAGLDLLARTVESDAAESWTLVSAMTPFLFVVIPMAAIGLVLHGVPVKVQHRNEWPVHFVNRGPGRVRFDGDQACFEWPGGSRTAPLDQLRGVEADGESVRVRCAEELELVMLPVGKPETPAGRRQQSQILARQLRARSSSATPASAA